MKIKLQIFKIKIFTKIWKLCIINTSNFVDSIKKTIDTITKENIFLRTKVSSLNEKLNRKSEINLLCIIMKNLKKNIIKVQGDDNK